MSNESKLLEFTKKALKGKHFIMVMGSCGTGFMQTISHSRGLGLTEIIGSLELQKHQTLLNSGARELGKKFKEGNKETVKKPSMGVS